MFDKICEYWIEDPRWLGFGADEAVLGFLKSDLGFA